MNLLLHMCCGPCSCYPVKKLREDGIEPTGYFFNPNIHPYKEWDMRLKTAKEFAEKVDMKIITDENYMLRDFLKKALMAESVENGRCRMCYTWRLEQAAKFAAENGFDSFTSTLFYSIYQHTSNFHSQVEPSCLANELRRKFGLYNILQPCGTFLLQIFLRTTYRKSIHRLCLYA